MSTPTISPELEKRRRNRQAHWSSRYKQAGDDPAAVAKVSFDRAKSMCLRAVRNGHPDALNDLAQELANLAERWEQIEAAGDWE